MEKGGGSATAPRGVVGGHRGSGDRRCVGEILPLGVVVDAKPARWQRRLRHRYVHRVAVLRGLSIATACTFPSLDDAKLTV